MYSASKLMYIADNARHRFKWVHSHLTYCPIIMSCTSKSNINRILKVQKKAIRIITNSNYNEHTAQLFRNLNILPFDKIIEQANISSSSRTIYSVLCYGITVLTVFRCDKISKSFSKTRTGRDTDTSILLFGLWQEIRQDFFRSYFPLHHRPPPRPRPELPPEDQDVLGHARPPRNLPRVELPLMGKCPETVSRLGRAAEHPTTQSCRSLLWSIFRRFSGGSDADLGGLMYFAPSSEMSWSKAVAMVS
jgi:hypothetical protein